MVNRISAQIIADSKNEQGDRITTYVLTFPRIVLAEFNTHRMISKNSASSRAIPFKTMVQKVLDEPFVPIAWQKEHKGMQGSSYFNPFESEILEQVWLAGRDAAVKSAQDLHHGIVTTKDGIDTNEEVTKQFCNRILEPYLYHTVICTGTEWQNFFALRAHPQAEIHIADLAQKMLDAYNESTPKELKAGEWHIPFGDEFDSARIGIAQHKLNIPLNVVKTEGDIDFIDLSESKVKIATARCARVSYLNFEGKDDYVADLKLHDILSESGHWSPFEHCARAMTKFEYSANVRCYSKDDCAVQDYGWNGNFKGFIQYRKTFQGENKTDPRVITK